MSHKLTTSVVVISNETSLHYVALTLMLIARALLPVKSQ